MKRKKNLIYRNKNHRYKLPSSRYGLGDNVPSRPAVFDQYSRATEDSEFSYRFPLVGKERGGGKGARVYIMGHYDLLVKFCSSMYAADMLNHEYVSERLPCKIVLDIDAGNPRIQNMDFMKSCLRIVVDLCLFLKQELCIDLHPVTDFKYLCACRKSKYSMHIVMHKHEKAMVRSYRDLGILMKMFRVFINTKECEAWAKWLDQENRIEGEGDSPETEQTENMYLNRNTGERVSAFCIKESCVVYEGEEIEAMEDKDVLLVKDDDEESRKGEITEDILRVYENSRSTRRSADREEGWTWQEEEMGGSTKRGHSDTKEKKRKGAPVYVEESRPTNYYEIDDTIYGDHGIRKFDTDEELFDSIRIETNHSVVQVLGRSDDIFEEGASPLEKSYITDCSYIQYIDEMALNPRKNSLRDSETVRRETVRRFVFIIDEQIYSKNMMTSLRMYYSDKWDSIHSREDQRIYELVIKRGQGSEWDEDRDSLSLFEDSKLEIEFSIEKIFQIESLKESMIQYVPSEDVEYDESTDKHSVYAKTESMICSTLFDSDEQEEIDTAPNNILSKLSEAASFFEKDYTCRIAEYEEMIYGFCAKGGKGILQLPAFGENMNLLERVYACYNCRAANLSTYSAQTHSSTKNKKYPRFFVSIDNRNDEIYTTVSKLITVVYKEHVRSVFDPPIPQNVSRQQRKNLARHAAFRYLPDPKPTGTLKFDILSDSLRIGLKDTRCEIIHTISKGTDMHNTKDDGKRKTEHDFCTWIGIDLRRGVFYQVCMKPRCLNYEGYMGIYWELNQKHGERNRYKKCRGYEIDIPEQYLDKLCSLCDKVKEKYKRKMDLK